MWCENFIIWFIWFVQQTYFLISAFHKFSWTSISIVPNCPSKYESIQQQYPLCYSKLQQNQITLNVCPTFYKIQGFTRCMKSLVYFARRTTKLRKALGLKALKKRDNEMHLTKLENLPSSIFHFHSVQLLGRIIPRQICKIEQIQKCQNGWFQF